MHDSGRNASNPLIKNCYHNTKATKRESPYESPDLQAN